MSDPRTDLPSPSAPNFNQRIRETLMTYLGRQGNPLDRGITLRDLLENGIIAIRDGYTLRPGSGTPPITPGTEVEGAYEPDLTPPPTPTGFTVGAAISHIFIEHDAALFTQGHGYLRTRVYGATWVSGPLPVFADAVEITQYSGTITAHPSNPATTWHLWIKWESRDGVLSAAPAGGTNGLSVTTGQNVADLLEALEGEITESQLYSTLADRIDLIDGPAGTPGTVAFQVAAEAAIRADQIAIESHQRLISINSTAEAALNALLAADNERTDRLADVALARTELGTDISEGLSAEATERTLLAAQIRGGYTGTDVNAITSGLLYEERIARATQDDALALQITLLAAGVGEQFDWAVIWYFDSGIEGWTGNGLPTATQGYLRAATQANGAYVESPSALGVDGDAHKQVRLRIRKGGAPTFAGYLWWADVAQGFDVGRRIALVEPSYDGNDIGLLTVNLTWTGNIDRIRIDLSDAQNGTDYFEIDWVAIGRPSPGASTAQLLEEQQARASADSAEASARETLATAILGQDDPTGLTLGALTQGLIYDERVARSTATGALASDISTLQASVTTLDGDINALESTVTTLEEAVADTTGTGASVTRELLSISRRLDADAETVLRNVLAGQATLNSTQDTLAFAKEDLSTQIITGLSAESSARLILAAQVNANAAAILNEQTARADGDSALASSVSTLTATANAKNRTYYQAEAPTIDLVAGDVWYDSNDGNKAYRWTGAVWTETTDTRIDANTAAIQTEATVRADETGHLGALYAVRVNLTAGGRTVAGGFGLAGTSGGSAGPTIDFGVRADKFYIGAPDDGSGIADVLPFVVVTTPTTINGVAVPVGVFMSAAYIQNGTITNGKIGNLEVDNAKIVSMSVDKLTAGSLAVGQYIQSTSYVAGTSGWRINADGTAELNNITARGTIYASAGTVGGVTIASNAVRAGQTAFDTGTGFYLGADGKLSVGNAAGNRLTWDGTALVVRNADASRLFDTGATGSQPVLKIGGALEILANGSATFAGALSAATGSFAGSLSAAAGTFTGELVAADGTFSGTLTADAINAVDTINIAGNAVTTMSTASASNATSAAVSGGYATALSTAITPVSGASLIVFTQIDVETYTTGSGPEDTTVWFPTAYLYRDGVQVSVLTGTGTLGTKVKYSGVYIDASPPTVSTTYSITLKADPGMPVSPIYFEARSISILMAKR